MESWPDSLQIRNKFGSVPLHYAFLGKLSLTAVQSLVEAWPDGVRVQDGDGLLPLHCACSHGCEENTITILLDSYPESLQIRTYDGKMPLHYSCLGKLSLTAIESMVQLWPMQFVSNVTPASYRCTLLANVVVRMK